jgi:multimeric flavodoxin WrbA
MTQRGDDVKLFDLRELAIGYCCGDQPCQDEGNCIYNDVVTAEIIPLITRSDALVIFTPTYFNAPPAVLKTFIDRCNLLLTVEPRKKTLFASWVSGQTEQESCEYNRNYLESFAEICGFTNLKNANTIRIEPDTSQTQLNNNDLAQLHRLSDIINQH